MNARARTKFDPVYFVAVQPPCMFRPNVCLLHTRNKIVPVHTVPPAMRTEPSRPSPRLSAQQLDLQLANIMSSVGLPFGYALDIFGQRVLNPPCRELFMARHTPKTISLCTLHSWSSSHSCRVDSQGSPTRLRCAAVLEENG
jgi:hypothetical protein